MSYIRAMMKRDKAMRITVGCRCAFKETSRWAKGKFRDFEPGRQCLVEKRDGSDLAVFVLPKGFTGKITKDITLHDNSVAWVDEDDLILIDRDYATNLDFLDWFAEIKEDICGDCGKHMTDEEGICPDPECPGNNLEDYIDDDDFEELQNIPIVYQKYVRMFTLSRRLDCNH